MVFADVSDDLPSAGFYLRQLLSGPHENFHYLAGAADAEEAFCVDPAFELDRLFSLASTEGRRVTTALFTHGHWDHIGGIPAIAQHGIDTVVLHEAAATHPKVAEAEAAGMRVRLVHDGDVLEVAGLAVKVLHTPGHQAESTCYLAAQPEQRRPAALFGGDTLFIDSCGRTDFPGGDTDAMFASMARLRELPEPAAVIVLPGHHYAAKAWQSLADQCAANPALSVTDRAAFEKLAFLRG